MSFLPLLQLQLIASAWQLFSHISSRLFLQTTTLASVCTYCEMERREFWQNPLISTEGAARCWKLGSGVMVLQQCLPGKVVPHHCQLLSDRKRGDGECGPYLLIKRLKTLAFEWPKENSYQWVSAFILQLLSAKGVSSVWFVLLYVAR